MAIKINGSDQNLAADVRGAQGLRGQFKSDPDAAVKNAAQEFEALFLQMVMKSMRATTSQDSLTDSETSRFFTGMFDEQLAQNLSRTGSIGLAAALETQLRQQMAAKGVTGVASSLELPTPEGDLPLNMPGSTFQGMSLTGVTTRPADLRGQAAAQYLANREVKREMDATPTVNMASGSPPANAKAFVDEMWPHAVEASRATGIPPQFLIAHAALESGWGQRDIRNADGSSSHNLFGIKAGKNWRGPTTEVLTTEYVNGEAVRQTEPFRAYASYAESFQDYANMLRNNPRYGAVIGSQNGTEFAKRLQQAGYATDPDYAQKLSGVIHGSTLRLALTS